MTHEPKPVRVLIADDHALFRAGLRALLEPLPDVTVVAEASDGWEALRLVAEHGPDVVLMDISMPGLNGLDATSRLSLENPAVRVLILSMHAEEEYVNHALRAGAAGYLLKDARRDELELALHAVARGETYLSPRVARSVVAGYVGHRGDPADSRLTPRQREILRLIAEGQPMKAIAARLGLSIKTVEGHRAMLMERLGIHDVPGLVRFAIRVGLVSADE